MLGTAPHAADAAILAPSAVAKGSSGSPAELAAPAAEPGAQHVSGASHTVSASGPVGTPQAQAGAAASAQGAAAQIVASLPRPLSELGTGTLEVALDPPELGRVRLSLLEVAGAMTVSITAERPETADLMRRHLDLLAQEFTRSGLDAPNVRIGGEGATSGGHGSRGEGEPAASSARHPEADTDQPLQIAAAPDSRRALDLRL